MGTNSSTQSAAACFDQCTRGGGNGDDVPFSFQTFVVLMLPPTIGILRGSLAVLMHISLGLTGVPVFAEYASGPSVAEGPNGGYIVGFFLAELVVGWACIKHKVHKHKVKCLGAMLAGNITIYIIGVPWLAVAASLSFGHVPARSRRAPASSSTLHILLGPNDLAPCDSALARDAMHKGFVVFILYDIIKVVLAALLVPTPWGGLQWCHDQANVPVTDAASQLLP